MASKIQPLDKTVVTEFRVSVSDIHMRTKQMNGSQPARVPRDSSFVSADGNVSTTQKILIQNVKKVIVINSWQDIFISLKNDTGSIENIPCTGLFIMYGEFDEVEIKAQSEGDMVRLTYLYA